MKIDFHPHYSDDSAHNSDTSFDHIKKFLHWMYDNKLFIKDGIIYDTTDGCSKQYRCENSMWLLSVLTFTHRLLMGSCINYPGHGKRKLDSIDLANNIFLF